LRKKRAVSSVSLMPPPSRPDPQLARVLRALREKDGRSQEALAHEAGLTVGALARIERAETNPTWTTVRQIAAALGIPLAALGRAVDRDVRP
jgi:transcriptional regulator with XRE-family HTH domain